MKTKELKNLKEKEVGELEKMVLELKKKAALAYMNIRIGKEKNFKLVKNLRREVAQVLTLIQEKVQTKKQTNKQNKQNKQVSSYEVNKFDL